MFIETSIFKVCGRKSDYLKSLDDKNEAFFMIYFMVQIVGVIMPTFYWSHI